MVDTITPVAGLLVVAFITPGPNNFIIMAAAARGGFRRTIPIMWGVVFGTLALFLLASFGLVGILAVHPSIEKGILIVGVCYLVVLGVRSTVGPTATGQEHVNSSEPSMVAMAVFQGLNPKSIVLIATIAAATTGNPAVTAVLVVVIALTATACLSVWSMAGSALSSWLLVPMRKRLFDTTMGLLLIASAVTLLLQNWDMVELNY